MQKQLEFIRRKVLEAKHGLPFSEAIKLEVQQGGVIKYKKAELTLSSGKIITCGSNINKGGWCDHYQISSQPYKIPVRMCEVLGQKITWGSIVNCLQKKNISIKQCHAHSEDECIFIPVCHRSELEFDSFRWDIFDKGIEQTLDQQTPETINAIADLLGFEM